MEQTLVLNASYEPINIVSWKRAITLLFQGKVEVLAEYDQAYDQGLRLLPRIPEAQLRQAGTLPWYGMEYSLEDFVVYQYYGHKREHCAQIAAFRDQFK